MSTDVTIIRQNIRYTTVLETETCGSCGIPFAMPKDMLDSARKNYTIRFFCPNGHKIGYSTDRVAELERQLKRSRELRDGLSSQLVHEADQRKAAERSAAAFKGQATRLRKRIGHGVCPCCHRTFKQVTAHMDRMHPGYADEPVTETS